MTGKEKCKLLKAIRQEIAETNGIVYLTSECTFKGECSGTCPKCDAEIRYLDSEINRLIATGKNITLSGLSLKTFEIAVNTSTDKPIEPTPLIDENRETEKKPDFDDDLSQIGNMPIHLGNPPREFEELDLSVRSFNRLRRAKLHGTADLSQKSVLDILRILYFNRECFAEVRTKLQSLNYDFKLNATSFNVIKNTLYGFAIADALGVPVRFLSREELAVHPVTDYKSLGTHLSIGTWSDNTSMTLATLDSLSFGLDYADIMKKFCDWADNAAYTATNTVFDVGSTVLIALRNFKNGQSPLSCGSCSQYDLDNRSLIRIIPAIFFIRHKMSHASVRDKLTIIHNISALTHGHPRTKMACGIYYFVLDTLLDAPSKFAVNAALSCAKMYYRNEPDFASELDCFERLFSCSFSDTPEVLIKSSCNVVDTLEASIWCLLNTGNYHDCVLKAVNLGNDTNTVAALAGGLAGCMYYGTGKSDIPNNWTKTLLNDYQIYDLCEKFCAEPQNEDIPVPVTMGHIKKI